MLHLDRGLMRCVRLGRGQSGLAAQRAHASAQAGGPSGRFDSNVEAAQALGHRVLIQPWKHCSQMYRWGPMSCHVMALLQQMLHPRQARVPKTTSLG